MNIETFTESMLAIQNKDKTITNKARKRYRRLVEFDLKKYWRNRDHNTLGLGILLLKIGYIWTNQKTKNLLWMKLNNTEPIA